MCRTQWPLTLTYIFQVIKLWRCLFYWRCVTCHFQINRSKVKVTRVIYNFAARAAGILVDHWSPISSWFRLWLGLWRFSQIFSQFPLKCIWKCGLAVIVYLPIEVTYSRNSLSATHGQGALFIHTLNSANLLNTATYPAAKAWQQKSIPNGYDLQVMPLYYIPTVQLSISVPI